MESQQDLRLSTTNCSLEEKVFDGSVWIKTSDSRLLSTCNFEQSGSLKAWDIREWDVENFLIESKFYKCDKKEEVSEKNFKLFGLKWRTDEKRCFSFRDDNKDQAIQAFEIFVSMPTLLKRLNFFMAFAVDSTLLNVSRNPIGKFSKWSHG